MINHNDANHPDPLPADLADQEDADLFWDTPGVREAMFALFIEWMNGQAPAEDELAILCSLRDFQLLAGALFYVATGDSLTAYDIAVLDGLTHPGLQRLVDGAVERPGRCFLRRVATFEKLGRQCVSGIGEAEEETKIIHTHQAMCGYLYWLLGLDSAAAVTSGQSTHPLAILTSLDLPSGRRPAYLPAG